MAYTKQTWTNGVSKLNATRMQHIEDGLETAALVGDNAAAAAAASLQASLVDAKGDLLVGTAADTVARLAAGANDRLLVADSAQSAGLKYALLTNGMVDPAAAIAYSKLSLASSIVNADISASAAIALSKLASTVPYVYDRVTADVDVTNSAAATDIYSKSIAANDLGTNRMLRLTLMGDFLYNSSGAALTLKVVFGATTVGSVSIGTSTTISATRVPLGIRVQLVNDGATNVQRVLTVIDNGFRGAHGTMNDGVGGWAIHDSNSIENTGGIMYDDAAEDTTSAKTLAVNAQWGTATTNLSLRIRYALLELI